MIHWGDYEVGDTIHFYFDSYDSAGASVTITGLAVTDLELYPGGSTTQRASDNGFALIDSDGIDVDGTTGLHGFSVDTGDNSDAGFFVAGQYLLNVNAVTIDGQTVRFSYQFTLGSYAKKTALATAQADLDTITGTDGAIIASGALTDATLAGNLEIVFETDFATNYNATRNAWATNVQDTVGTGTLGLSIPTAANIVDEWETQSQADPTGFHVNVLEVGGTAQTAGDILDKMLAYVQLICRSDIAIRTDRSTELSEINNDEGTGLGDYTNDENSLEQGTDNIDLVRSYTDDIGTAGAGLTNVPWNSSWDTEVQSEVDDALVALHLDHLLAATYDPASKPGAADALLNELIESDGGVSRYTANALEQAPSGGGATTDDEDLPPASSFYFTKASQTTSPHTITRLAGFDGPLQFDFSPDELFGDEVISSNTTPTVTRTAGSGADPTVDNVRYDATKKKLMFDLDASSAAAGTFTITASVTKSGTIYKQGTFILKAAS